MKGAEGENKGTHNWNACYMHERWDLGHSNRKIRAMIRSGPFVTLKDTGEVVHVKAVPEYFPNVGEETLKRKQAIKAWATSLFLPKGTSLLNMHVASQSEKNQQSQQNARQESADSPEQDAARERRAYGTVVGMSSLNRVRNCAKSM